MNINSKKITIMDSKTEPASEAKKTAYFLLSRNGYGKAWLFYKPIKHKPGRYSCWEPIDDEFYSEFEKLQQAQEEITRLKAELERERELRKEALVFIKEAKATIERLRANQQPPQPESEQP